MKDYPLVYIIVLNWNGGTLPISCIDSLFRNTNYKNFKVVVVDNGSTDGSTETIQKKVKNITFIQLRENFGFSKGMNVGAWYALRYHKPKYVIFLNNDITFPCKHRNWLSDLISDLEENKQVAISAPKIKLPNGRIEGAWILKGRFFLRRSKVSTDVRKKCHVTHCTGACLLIKSSVLKEIGFYDERFSPFWFEDMDLFLRVKKSGYSIIYNPTHTLNHVSSATIKRIDAAQIQSKVTLFNRNLIRHRYKNLPFYVFLLTLCTSFIRSFILYGRYVKFFYGNSLANKKLKIISFNPFSILRLIKQIDLRKEKVRLPDNEALSRIKYIKKL